MIYKAVIRILSVSCVLVHSFRDDYLNQLVLRFVYRNEKICGDPFSSLYWVPAMERCRLSCDPAMSICKENSNNINEQTCESLPRECIIMLRKSLGWRNYDEFSNDKNENIPRIDTPKKNIDYAIGKRKVNKVLEEKKLSTIDENRSLNDIINKHPAINNNHPIQMPSIRPRDVEKTIFSNKHENFVQTATRPKTNFLPGLRKLAMKREQNPIVLTDKSKNCCEWALNGLCDQNWKKIREMCPVSCGKLSCEIIEGITTCSRTININIEDCLGSVESNNHIENDVESNESDNEDDLSERTYKKFIFF